MSRDTFDYSHGDTGTEPPTALNFQSNQRPNSEYFDWWWYTVITALNGHADEFNRLDGDNDGIVDEADTANTYKENDIDRDGDGVVDEADTANTYKENDIDNDGDGVVNDSDKFDGLDPRDGNNGQLVATDGETTYWTTPGYARSLVDGSGAVDVGDIANLHTTHLADGETFEVTRATFLNADGTPAPSGCDLVIASLDNSGSGTSRTTIVSGDGNSVYDYETGDPLASYTNGTGSAETVMVGADNGHFNSGSGEVHDLIFIAEVVVV